jgi:hypothetical protein
VIELSFISDFRVNSLCRVLDKLDIFVSGFIFLKLSFSNDSIAIYDFCYSFEENSDTEKQNKSLNPLSSD